MQNIIYQTDSGGDRIGNANFTGEFHPDSTKDNCWLYIRDEEGKAPCLGKGDYICYSGYDISVSDGVYIIIDCNDGIFRVKKI